MLWAELCPPTKRKGYVEVLSPSTSKCEFIWQWGHCRYNYLKRGHTGVGRPYSNVSHMFLRR